MNFSAQEVRLADSMVKKLSGSAALCDTEYGVFYLFGGSIDSAKYSCIQVYKPPQNVWILLTFHMIYPRSVFSAIKYQRKAYLVGGNDRNDLEVFDLNTGEIYENNFRFP